MSRRGAEFRPDPGGFRDAARSHTGQLAGERGGLSGQAGDGTARRHGPGRRYLAGQRLTLIGQPGPVLLRRIPPGPGLVHGLLGHRAGRGPGGRGMPG